MPANNRASFLNAAHTLARPPGQKGTPSAHPILGDELRALRRLQREQEPKSTFVFTSERQRRMFVAAFCVEDS
jgi:hypothetical protein